MLPDKIPLPKFSLVYVPRQQHDRDSVVCFSNNNNKKKTLERTIWYTVYYSTSKYSVLSRINKGV